ncbi:PepSY domain-containing protein, partial [Pseudomonas aeruginosa]
GGRRPVAPHTPFTLGGARLTRPPVRPARAAAPPAHPRVTGDHHA